LSAFPPTRHSAVVAIRSSDDGERGRGYDAIVSAYWRPAYLHLRRRWGLPPEDASDVVQGFFADAFEKGTLERFDSGRARFRTWLRVCLDGYAGHVREAAATLKRGGGWTRVPLDFEDAEKLAGEGLGVAGDDPDERFRVEWVRSVLQGALEDLERHAQESGREVAFRMFVSADVDTLDRPRPSYDDLARAHGVPVTTVTNHLHRMRREFRAAAIERIREMTLDEQEFREEVRALLGQEPG
jgi:DNA-directed RNA polymerase specialized sigma24 family protein